MRDSRPSKAKRRAALRKVLEMSPDERRLFLWRAKRANGIEDKPVTKH